MLRSLATISGFTALSRILGFVRDIFIARYLGTGLAAEAFVAAFRFPNMFRRIFGEGAFNAAFVPLFGRELTERGNVAAQKFARESFSLLGGVLLLVTLVAIPGMDWVMAVFTQGFRDRPEVMELTVAYGRIAFSYLLCMALAAHLSGVLNTLKIFAMPAFAPVLLNAIFLIGLTIVVPLGGFRDDPVGAGYVLVWCVFVAGWVQLAALWIASWRKGFRILPVQPSFSPGMRRLTALMGPGVLSAGVQQINLLVGTMIASSQQSALPFLYYADRISQLPLGMIGIAFGVVLLPELTRCLRESRPDDAGETMARGVVLSMLITVPAAVALMTIPREIVGALFERNAFDAESTRQTAAALAAFAAGLPGYVLIKVLQPGYFAQENTRSPMIMAVAMVAVNIALSLALFPFLGHVGIAIATSAAAWVNVAALALGLQGFFKLGRQRIRQLAMMALSAGLMSAALAGGRLALSGLLQSESAPLELTALGALIAGGAGVYLLATLALRATSLAELRSGFQKRRA